MMKDCCCEVSATTRDSSLNEDRNHASALRAAGRRRQGLHQETVAAVIFTRRTPPVRAHLSKRKAVGDLRAVLERRGSGRARAGYRSLGPARGALDGEKETD